MEKKKLWNLNFLLLWQGQFVSAVGDVAYEIALGFWILAVTGSTGLMGTLMAASTIPRVLLSPLAGVVVDRVNRKWLLVLMDAVRGGAVVLVAIGAYQGTLQVWMVFAAGIVIGLGAAFFNPSILSIVPDIVKREQIIQANSYFSMIRAGSGILGNSLGGMLFSILGAPLMFLVNGLSYLFSSITELFIKVPVIQHHEVKPRFMEELKAGLSFVWTNRGLKFLMIAAGGINFFAFIGIVLVLPLFQRSDFLGPTRYGIMMAVFTGGMILGMGAAAAVKIPSEKRLPLFGLSTVLFVIALALLPLWETYWVMLVCGGVGGFFNAIVNVLIQGVMQLTVPAAMRGKVFGLLETLAGGLTPIGMAVGGLLGEFLPLEWVIFGAFTAIGLFIFPQLGSRGVREFFSMDRELE